MAEKHLAFVMRDGVCTLEEITGVTPPYADACRPLYLARVRAHCGLREVANALQRVPAEVSGMELGRTRPDDLLLRFYADRFGVDAQAIRAALEADDGR